MHRNFRSASVLVIALHTTASRQRSLWYYSRYCYLVRDFATWISKVAI